jgi:hypothetical protein
MARVLNMPFFILATVHFIADGVFSYVTQPVSELISNKAPLEREFG